MAGRASGYPCEQQPFLYYVKAEPHQVVCPEVFVAFGSHKRLVNIYQTWTDGPFPQLIIELTSRSTRAEDEGPKRTLYERLGVLEYYLFDPLDPMEDDELEEPERAGELMRDQRPSSEVPFGPVERVAPGAAIYSALLGVGFIVEGRELRVVNETATRVLRNPDEEALARQAAEEQARHERAAREAFEARAQALADELARLRGQRGDQHSQGKG